MVTSFPFGNDLINASFALYRGTTTSLIQFVPLIFVIRLVIIKATLGGTRDYGELIKELIFLYVGFFIFQEIMELVMKAPQIAEAMISRPVAPQVDMLDKEKSVFYYITGLSSSDLMKMLSTFIYWFVCFLYLVIMALMIAIGAYIILFSTLFKMRWMISAYMSLVLILSMWPFVWYSVDQAFVFAVNSLKHSNSQTGAIVASVIGAIVKLSVPVIGIISAMKTPVGTLAQMKENLSAGAKPIKGSLSTVKNTTQKVGRSLGLDVARESFRSDPIAQERKRSDKLKNRRFSASHFAPFVAYKSQNLANSLKGNLSKSHNSKNSQTFKDFVKTNEVKLIKRKSIEASKKQSYPKNAQEFNKENSNLVSIRQSKSKVEKSQQNNGFKNTNSGVTKTHNTSSEKKSKFIQSKAKRTYKVTHLKNKDSLRKRNFSDETGRAGDNLT